MVCAPGWFHGISNLYYFQIQLEVNIIMSRRRGIIWIIAGLVLAGLAACLSYFAFQQVVAQQQALPVEQPSNQTVVVARQAVNERAVIRLADISTEERPIEEVPSGAVFKTEDAVGRIASRPIPAGQVLLAQHMVESFPSAGSSGLQAADIMTETINFNEALGEDLVAYALPATDRLSMEGILLAGDHVDLLFSTDVTGEQEGTGGKVAIYAIQDVEILQIIYQPPPPPPPEEQQQEGQPPADSAPLIPKMLILAIDPQDATVLKYALDVQAPIDVALRAGDNRRLFEVDAVTINTIAERYDFVSPRPIP
jgi:Flp pilus assembly protein CpaB